MSLLRKNNLLSFGIPEVINDIFLVDNLGQTPAMCFRKTRTIFISPEFLKLPVDYQRFIIGHEAGHIALNTRDEFAADDFAVNWCISQNMSLTNCLFAMTKVLSFPDNRPNQKNEQIMRCHRQFERLMDYDANINKNPKAMSYINNTIDNEFDSFGGKFKKAVKKVIKKPVVKAVFAPPIAKPFIVAKAVKKALSKPIVKKVASPINPFKKLSSSLNKPLVKALVLPHAGIKTAVSAIQSNLNLLPAAPAPAQQGINDFLQNQAPSQPYNDYSDNGGYSDDGYEEDYYEEDYSDEEYSDEDYSDEDYSDGEYVDETISEEYDSFGGLFKARKERKKTKVEAKAQKKRDEGEAKKMKAQATLELAKQGIVNKGLAGLGDGLGKLKMGDKIITEGEGDTGKIMGMSKPMFFGVVAAVVVLAVVTVWYFKFKK